jgi:hypothetical protein
LIHDLSTFVLAGLLLSQSQTVIETGPLRVAWSAPAACPRAEDVHGRVRALLTAEIAAVLRHTLEVSGVIEPLDSGRFALDLEIREGSSVGTRRLEAETCEDVAQAGALVIALTINPELYESQARVDPSSPATSAPPVSPASLANATEPRSEPPLPAAERSVTPEGNGSNHSVRARPGFRFGIGVGGVVDAGSVPGIDMGPELLLHARWRALSAELFGAWLPPRRALAPGYSNVGGAVELLTLGLRACVATGRTKWLGGGCAAFELGRLQGQAFGAVDNGSGDITWVAPGAGLVGEYRWAQWLSLRARIEAFVPLDQSEFIVENVGPVHAPSVAVGRLGLGVIADFW